MSTGGAFSTKQLGMNPDFKPLAKCQQALMVFFDTDILSYLMKGKLDDSVKEKFLQIPAHRAALTTINLAELHFGALRSTKSERWIRAIDQVTNSLNCFSFDRSAALAYAKTRTLLEKSGTPLAEADLRIAAIVLSQNGTLITNNIKHFSRVPGLRYENWIASTDSDTD